MAKKVTFVCDRCGNEETNCSVDLPRDWQEVSLVITDKDKKVYTLCFHCRVKLRLVNQWTGESVSSIDKKTADSLLELFEGET